jgi:hypothetical protein
MAIRDTQDCLIFEVPTVGTGGIRDTQDCLIFEVPIPVSSIVYPVTPPAITGIGPQDFTLAMVNDVGETVSPFTFGQQEQQWPGQMFTIEANLPPMPYAEAEQWIAFLGSLFGKYGTFEMGDYNRPSNQGLWSGSPVISGSNANGSNSLNLRGAAGPLANWAVAGDYLQVSAGAGQPKRLYKVLQNAASSAGGAVALSIFPNIRETLSDGTAIVIANCVGTFRMQENTVTPKVDRNRMYTISFKAKEAI